MADLHPLRPDWHLVTANAQNGSGFVIWASSILDTATGAIIASSTPTAPVFLHGVGWSQVWSANNGVLLRSVHGYGQRFYIALQDESLELLGMGSFPLAAGDDNAMFGADEDVASIVYTYAGNLIGGSMPVFNRTQATAELRTTAERGWGGRERKTK
jgi:hypothetical protein